jgi:hypothetical protein
MNMKLRPGKAHVALVLATREVRDLCTFPHSAQGWVEGPDEDTYDNYDRTRPRITGNPPSRG